MGKKIQVGRSENLFILSFIFLVGGILKQKENEKKNQIFQFSRQKKKIIIFFKRQRSADFSKAGRVTLTKQLFKAKSIYDLVHYNPKIL